ncbi:MAG: hypothetical protein H0V36_04395 [Chloroflexi bacterium]|nr:hypothetical protein [Chloroflexota bacterium]
MRTYDADVVPQDPFEWRPQRPKPARRTPPVRDPIVEPLWSGIRVIAHFELTLSGPDDQAVPAPRIRLIDGFGEDVSALEPVLLQEIADGVLAMDAVIDGVLTRQATRGGEGAAILHHAHISPVGMLMSREARLTVDAPIISAADSPVAFVCLDLLRVDGEPLLDLPLLERKRQLEGVIRTSERLRISPFTRPPVDRWVASWQAAGFQGAMLKEANGHYRPGGLAADWVTVTRIRQR